jgi:hypothetical protein
MALHNQSLSWLCGCSLPQANQLNVTALLTFPAGGADAIVSAGE